MKNLFVAAMLPLFLFQPKPKESYLITGTYTGGKSKGIYVFKFNHRTGEATEVSVTETSNPSFVAVSPGEQFVFAVHEDANGGKGGKVSSYRFDKQSGRLTLINTQSTEGDHPCYVDVDKTGRWVFTANYSSGSLSVLPVQPDGSLGKATQTIVHEGSGANKQRQEKPHVHATYVSPDNKFLLVPDLGIDKIMVYAFDAATGRLTPASQPFLGSEPGAGPRHVDFAPNGKTVYAIEELTGHVTVYRNNDGKFEKIQRISTVKPGASGFAGSADIHVSKDGKYLYASNRGDFNDIAVYEIHKADGALRLVSHHDVGSAPRNFTINPTGKYLLAGSQGKDEIVVFQRSKATGQLKDTGKRIAVGKPVCLKWVGMN